MLKNVIQFYTDGFKSMTTGKTLWIIIAIKLFIMFFILRMFFFPNFLNSKFKTSKEKGDYVIENLTKTK